MCREARRRVSRHGRRPKMGILPRRLFLLDVFNAEDAAARAPLLQTAGKLLTKEDCMAIEASAPFVEPTIPTEERESANEQGVNEETSFPIVGVGASAGGLEAFTQLLKALPADTGMAFVLVQHLAPTHPSALAEILSRATTMSVMEVEDESPVKPNHVYVIPPGRSMVIVNGTLQLLPREGHGLHRPIDQFFRALAEDLGHQAIGVVLSGTASDGTLGLQAIKAEGGITFAQDATAQHEGMPHSAVASGCVDFVLPPLEIAREIVRISKHPYAIPAAPTRKPDDKPNLADVIDVLRNATGVDFTHYKFNTLYRRVTRRMVFQKIDKLDEYVEHLRQTPAEVESLYQDILISVTSFFRDPEAFEVLKSVVFPRLLKDRSCHDPVRFWTLGCSTGQEAYSLAMAYTEAAEAAGSSVPFQLFATDLNPAGIEKARAGVYPRDIVHDVSPERLKRFFTETEGGYQISKIIRDACIFSRHNVLADPPFSRIDMISCRNLLIYLEPILQQRIVPTLHYSLKPDGCLWLGGSETIGSYRNLFEAEDAKHKIYSKKPGPSPRNGPFPITKSGGPRSRFIPSALQPTEPTDLPREADRVLLTKFAPPGVLITADLDIVQYRGDTSPYLAPAPGKASLSLLKMLREGLLVGVRSAVLRAREQNAPVRESGMRINSGDGHRDVAIEVIPVRGQRGPEAGFLVLFEENTSSGPRELHIADVETDGDVAASENARLAQELAGTREYLQSVIEQQETANEELQSANEEVQSANEELQSTNEELETSKEEIQSSNEELATVNDELVNRIAESNLTNNDLNNLISSVEMAIVMVGPDLRVRRFTPLAEKLLNLIPSDVGRPLADIKLNLETLPDLEPLLTEVLTSVTPQEHDVRDKHGHWYSLRLRPYRTTDNKIDGVVVMLVDIDLLKRAQIYTESIVATVHEPLLVLDDNLKVRTASRAFYHEFRESPETIEGRLLFELGNGQWDISELRRLLEEVLLLGKPFEDFEVEYEFEQLGKRTMVLNGRQLLQIDGPTQSILLAIQDITERKQVENVLHASEERYRALFNSAPMAVYVCNQNAVIQEFNARAAELWGREPVCGVETFCGSLRMWRTDGTPLPHDQCPVAAVLQTGNPANNMDVVIERPDGSRIPVLVNIAALKDERGRILGSVTSFVDISERKRAEEALKLSEIRYRRLFETAKDGILIVDADSLKITHVNPFLLELLDYPAEHFLGKELWEIGFLRDKQASLSAMQQLDKLGSIRYESLPLEDRHGETHPVEMVANVYEEGRRRVIQCNIRDISERSRLEGLLRGQAAQLSDLHRRKDEFLAMLSHELRSPLAPISNAVELLGLQKGLESRVHQQARLIIERQIHQLEHLVDDLLEVSRITTGRVQLRRDMVDMNTIANGAAEAVRPLVDQRHHELTISLPPEPIWLLADSARLEQVIVNLLTNAAKYTEQGGHIWLTVEVDGTKKAGSDASTAGTSTVVIRVRDTGVGISPTLLPHVFDLFTQAERTLARSEGGLGIGLALVQRLTELHGGNVKVLSTPGHGSEFVVRIPIVAADGPPPPSPDPETCPPAVRPLRVLVVDDNVDSVLSLALLLESSGHEVRTAYDGPTGLQTALDQRPDVVLLDIGLPGLNGYEVARRIRQEPTLLNVVLIALTGYGHEVDRQFSQKAGFNHHLVKPTNFKKLQEILASDSILAART